MAATLDDLKDAVKQSLEANGSLRQLKAQMRAEIFRTLDDDTVDKPKLSNTNLIINELIREYLDFNHYKHTKAVFLPETGQPEEAPFERSFLEHELSVPQNEDSPLTGDVCKHLVFVMDASNPNGDMPVQQPPTDSVSCLSFSPTANILVAGSWNKEVRCWEMQANGQTIPKAMMSHNAPVLCTDFSPDGAKVVSGGCDKVAKLWDLASQQSQQFGSHDAPIKEVFWVPDMNMVVTGSWDKTLKYWDMRSPNAVATVPLPDRVYSMDVRHPLAVVACADRKIVVYDLRKPQQPMKNIQSPLKFQSTCVRAFPDKSGFAIGSIEGRVAIQHVDQSREKNNFAFKCHRQNLEVYAVNDISFHPQYGTFSTCGSDGCFTFWDKDSKQRLLQFKRCNNSITCSKFNKDGTIFAYAVCYDWSKGHAFANSQCAILLHPVKYQEIGPRKGR